VSFAVMLVHVDLDDFDARVRLAAQLAGRFSSTLIGVSAEGCRFVRRRGG
jgi:hypothetical protein